MPWKSKSILLFLGTLLHFEDHALKNLYFLDPQWLAKLMADVIHPSAEEEGSPIRNGVCVCVCVCGMVGMCGEERGGGGGECACVCVSTSM